MGITLSATAAVAALLATALDRMAGPGRFGRSGSVLRGCVLGMGGTASVAVGGYSALQADVGDWLPVPAWFAAAAVPFAAVAALQWPGVVRIGASALLVAGALAVVVPAGQRAQEEDLAERITTEVGTTEHPWVSDLDGYENAMPQHTGSPLIWTPLDAGSGRPEEQLWLFRDQPAAGIDPCAAPFVRTPAGEQEVTSCTQVRDLRCAVDGQELVRSDDDVRIGVMGGPQVPVTVLEDALANARPMTDDEYAIWLDEGMTPGW